MTRALPALAAPSSTTAVDGLRRGLDTFGPRDRVIARFLIDHAEELPFLSAGEIAETLEVSGSAITRFCQRVGYEGYPHLQRVIRQELRATLGVQQAASQDAAVATFWVSERSNLDTLSGIPERQLLAFARVLARARQVWLLGARSSYGLALIAESMLSSFRPRVQARDTDELKSRPELLLEMDGQDVALVYTVRRYSRATTHITSALKAQGVRVLLLTDQGATPLGKIADQTLRLPTQGSEVLASLAPFVSLTTLMVSLVARELGGEHFARAEALKAEFGVYEY